MVARLGLIFVLATKKSVPARLMAFNPGAMILPSSKLIANLRSKLENKPRASLTSGNSFIGVKIVSLKAKVKLVLTAFLASCVTS